MYYVRIDLVSDPFCNNVISSKGKQTSLKNKALETGLILSIVDIN